jgi:hypothetical protein
VTIDETDDPQCGDGKSQKHLPVVRPLLLHAIDGTHQELELNSGDFAPEV